MNRTFPLGCNADKAARARRVRTARNFLRATSKVLDPAMVQLCAFVGPTYLAPSCRLRLP
jgi:hypothetical protein